MGRNSAANEKLSDNIGDGRITPEGGRLYVSLHGAGEIQLLTIIRKEAGGFLPTAKAGGLRRLIR